MKNLTTKFVIAFAALMLGATGILAQEGSAMTVTPNSEIAAGLDLHAVAELFKNSETLEKFEKSLNDPQTGINNLDVDQNGEVDFIRVTEQVKDDTHLVILQTVLGEDNFQDVATIAVEQESGGKYNLQLQGDAGLYGTNYYVVPAGNDFSAWNVVRWLFRPNYVAYVSPYGYAVRPHWWGIRRPVALNLYSTRTGAFVGRRNFVASRTFTVRTINKINYRPRTATVVTRRNNVIRTNTNVVRPKDVVQTRTVTTTKTRPGTQTTTTRTRVVRGRRN